MKSWLISDEDLQVMYSKAGDKKIWLWCDGKPQSTGRKRKNLDRDSEDLPHSSKHTTNFNSDEEEIETCVRELQDIHGDKYSYGECRNLGKNDKKMDNGRTKKSHQTFL